MVQAIDFRQVLALICSKSAQTAKAEPYKHMRRERVGRVQIIGSDVEVVSLDTLWLLGLDSLNHSESMAIVKIVVMPGGLEYRESGSQ